MGGKELDLNALYIRVVSLGGFAKVSATKVQFPTLADRVPSAGPLQVCSGCISGLISPGIYREDRVAGRPCASPPCVCGGVEACVVFESGVGPTQSAVGATQNQRALITSIIGPEHRPGGELPAWGARNSVYFTEF